MHAQGESMPALKRLNGGGDFQHGIADSGKAVALLGGLRNFIGSPVIGDACAVFDQRRVRRHRSALKSPLMNGPCPMAKSQPNQPTLLESAGEAMLLLVIVAVIAIVPLLVCEWLARIALPLPANGTPETQQAVTAQRESLAKMLFSLLWAVLGGWLIFIG